MLVPSPEPCQPSSSTPAPSLSFPIHSSCGGSRGSQSSPDHDVIVIDPGSQGLVGKDTTVSYDDAAAAAEAAGEAAEAPKRSGNSSQPLQSPQDLRLPVCQA